MNSYFKYLIFTLCLIGIKPVDALDLQGLYSSSCTRDIGVILSVDRANVYLLNLQGKVVFIPRYDIVGIASYPINHIPISSIEFPQNLASKIKYHRIKTEYKKSLVDLVEGWPIGFSKDKISFLDKEGREIAVERNNIWAIETSDSLEHREFVNEVRYRYDFLHPTSMAKCEKQLHGSHSESAKLIDIIPQEFISDTIAIKRKFDSILNEHEVVKMYDRSQKFYPVPEVYKNIVTLGFWGTIGSRYGSSKNRTNNGAPILEEDFSTGPFGYQHIFLTGASPNSLFIHEEPQTQIFYRFKADYFHMSILYDPNDILVGSKFSWQENDLSNGEFRMVENFLLEAGLDFGHFSLLIIPTSNVEIGTKSKASNANNWVFNSNSTSLPRYGISYQNHLLKADIVKGQISKSLGGHWSESYTDFEYFSEYVPGVKHTIDYLRINGEFEFAEKYKLSGSYIHRLFKADNFKSKSFTGAVFLDYKVNYKYLTRGMLAVERISSNQAAVNYEIKIGANFSIIF